VHESALCSLNLLLKCQLLVCQLSSCQAHKVQVSGEDHHFRHEVIFCLPFKFARYNHAFILGTRTTLEIFARHSAADHVSDKSMHLKHHQKDAIVRSIHDQPNITAKELYSNCLDTPDSIDFTRRKSFASIISKERTAELSTKLEGVVVSDSTSSLRELCNRLSLQLAQVASSHRRTSMNLREAEDAAL
jgi:hypothetical protein